MEFKHYSVLLKESVDYLNVSADGIYADATLGGGGHSYEILSRGAKKLIGIDLPDEQIEAVVDFIKAKIGMDKISDALGGLKGLFGK